MDNSLVSSSTVCPRLVFALLVAAVGALGASASASKMHSTPVMVGGEPTSDACPSQGVVHGLRPGGGGYLAVRSGPGRHFPMIDRLRNGNSVYFCDEQGDWIGIVYGPDPTICGVSAPLAERQPYAGACQSGWAHRNWLTLVAG